MPQQSSDAEAHMTSQPKAVFERRVIKVVQPDFDPPHSGVLILDSSMAPIGSDKGAAKILKSTGGESGGAALPLALPDDLLKTIRNRCPADGSCVTTHFMIGPHRYRCRSYIANCEHPNLNQAVIVLHFEAESHGNDPISEIAAGYRLTEREEEALRGIALGLTTKELAHRMKISPNTVKAFVRLIMIKLGVTTRAAIMVKVLGTYGRK